MENACVIGYGVVGQATANLFGIKKHFDTDETKSNITLAEAANCKFIFICLPTPVDDSGIYHTDDIVQTIGQLNGYRAGGIYIIRSTVWPGFAQHIQKELGINRIISNPEFLTESTAEQDSKYPPFVLLGGMEGAFIKEVKAFYEGRIRSCPIILTDNTTAELAKLAMNAYFSTKVIFANQLFDAAQKLNANYERIKDVLERHPFGPKNHFEIWFKGKRGVNGKCLPKDTKAFAYYTGSELAKTAMALNESYIYLKENE